MSSNEGLTVTRHKTVLTTANPFEQEFGYHRAIRRGPFITVSGTTALKLLSPQPSPSSTEEVLSGAAIESENSKVHFPGDAYGQSVHVLETCLAAVVRLGGRKEDVVRVRMFVANSKNCGIVGSAFKKIFGTANGVISDDLAQDEDVVATAATMIVVPGGFVDGDILVEIELEAFVV